MSNSKARREEGKEGREVKTQRYRGYGTKTKRKGKGKEKGGRSSSLTKREYESAIAISQEKWAEVGSVSVDE